MFSYKNPLSIRRMCVQFDLEHGGFQFGFRIDTLIYNIDCHQRIAGL